MACASSPPRLYDTLPLPRAYLNHFQDPPATASHHHRHSSRSHTPPRYTHAGSRHHPLHFPRDEVDGDVFLLVGLARSSSSAEAPARGGPRAAREAVEGLRRPVVSSEGGACGVCKDELHAGDDARELPWSHVYHAGCILPWLDVAATCPLCRYQLPASAHHPGT